MIKGFTTNKSVLYLIALLKAHDIRKVIISPGTTNLEFVAGLQYAGDFELFSCVDERSAAYMACGMATECNEPIVITCTEATASRNYFPGLTEAYYRKLAILTVTGVHRYYQIGHLIPQIIDREISPRDVFVKKYRLPIIKDEEDEYYTQMMINSALLELKRKNSGPIHIDLPCCNNNYSFNCEKLPDVKVITRFFRTDTLPDITNSGHIAIFIGAHSEFTKDETDLIEKFCEKFNAVVFCEHTSGYRGNYAVNVGIISCQKKSHEIFENIKTLIHMGEQNSDYSIIEILKNVQEVWRLSNDGELRDTFLKLKYVFSMNTGEFFEHYLINDQGKGKPLTLSDCKTKNISYYMECKKVQKAILNKICELPFSNVYIAYYVSSRIPEFSTLHIGVSNSLRAWNLFEIPKTVFSFSNVGCRGIDGALSSCVGAAIANQQRLHFCVLGDLTFFYDMNALGNREIKRNIRILLVNNNGGNIFKHKYSPGYMFFGDDETGKYISASGHFGNQSRNLVKHFAEDLGIRYLTASNKKEFEKGCNTFLNNLTDESIIYEVFTTDIDERDAFEIIETLDIEN